MTDQTKNLGNLLSESFKLFTDRLAPLVLIGFYIYIPVSCLLLIYFVRNGFPYEKPIQITKEVPVSSMFDSLILTILSVLAYFLFQIAVMKVLKAVEKNETISLKECFRGWFKAACSLTLIAIHVGVRLLPWLLLYIIPLVVMSVYLRSQSPTSASYVIIANFLLGLCVFVIVIVICFFYAFSNYAFLKDDKKGREALGLSKKIIKENIWKFLGSSLALITITFLVGIVGRGILQFIFGKISSTNIGILPIAGFIIEYSLRSLLNVFGFIFFYLLYQDLKKRPGIAP